MPAKQRYMLIDGNALIHRGYHAIPVLNTKSGEQTNAVYGFTVILLKAIKDLKPTHIACTFDLAGPTFRHEQYKEYKATRVKADQELYDQIPRVKEVVKALNIPIFEREGFEADDLLGSLSIQIHKMDPEAEVIIATGDLDTLQLVNHKIKVYTLRKGITDTAIYDAKAVRERYGFLPEQMIDYKALRGDPSDNIPGVKGIGEKTASDLIKEFKSLDGLYKAIALGKTGEKIKPRILELLKAQEKEARMSYELSKIVVDLKIDPKIPAYSFGKDDAQKIVGLFQKLEFRSLLNKLPKSEDQINRKVGGSEDRESDEDHKDSSVSANIGKQDYVLLDTEEKLERALKELSKAEEISIDTETISLNIIDAELVGIGLSAKPGKAYYMPASLALQSKELKSLLANNHIKKIGHNLKYDFQILITNHYSLSTISFDTMIASYLLNAGTRQHNLDALAFSELGYQMQPITDLIGTGKNQITMDKVSVEKVSWYCSEDVDMTLRLKQLYEPQIKKQGLAKVFEEIEMPLIEVLARMETYGIKLAAKMLNRLAGEAEIEIKRLEKEI